MLGHVQQFCGNNISISSDESMIVAKDIFIAVERKYMNISANSNGLISEIKTANIVFKLQCA